jgi:hypothetical protein
LFSEYYKLVSIPFNFPLFKAVLQVMQSSHRQTENEFLSTHFSLWGKGKSHRGLNLVNGGVGALECTYRLKTASPRGRCELVHYLDAESMIFSSTIPAFSSSLVLGAWSGPPFDPQIYNFTDFLNIFFGF